MKLNAPLGYSISFNYSIKFLVELSITAFYTANTIER